MRLNMYREEQLTAAIGGFCTYIGSATLGFILEADFVKQLVIVLISGGAGIVASTLANMASTYLKYYLEEKRKDKERKLLKEEEDEQ